MPFALHMVVAFLSAGGVTSTDVICGGTFSTSTVIVPPTMTRTVFRLIRSSNSAVF